MAANIQGLAAWLLLLVSLQATAQERLRLATTTSTDNSGLLAVLHPPFEREHGVKVDVIAVGSGKALKLGENGDVDVILAHAPGAERNFVAAGYGVERAPVMHNDFVLLGPAADPAGAGKMSAIVEALVAIARHEQAFVSRGDDSGTHKKEKSLWRQAGIDPAGEWLLAVGQGMGAAPENRRRQAGLHPVRPRHLFGLQGQNQLSGRQPRRPDALQPLPCHFGQSGKTPPGKGRLGPEIHRLHPRPAGAGHHQKFHRGRLATVRAERGDKNSVTDDGNRAGKNEVTTRIQKKAG